MKIALIHNAKFPVLKYGGTERVIWWLAKGLSELNHEVTLVCAPSSQCPFARVVEWDFSQEFQPECVDSDVFHYFNTPPLRPERPYLVTIEGNGKPNERFWQNTVFVSRNHARRHGAQHHVYNGVDPDDYYFREKKNRKLLFLAKASWKLKNVRGAIRIARQAGREIDILGGSRWWLPRWRGASWRGMLGGPEKNEYLANSSGMVFPVLWHEPFGVAVVEALISGTPVLASPFGSLPELVNSEVGSICQSVGEFVEAAKRVDSFSPRRCREWALDNFHYQGMTRSYLAYYQRILDGEFLHDEDVVVDSSFPLECSLS